MEIIIIIGLVLLNGVLSMSEMALVSARKSRLETQAKKGSKSASAALRLINEPDKFLSSIQIGITLIGILTGLFSGEAFSQDVAEWLKHIPLLAPYALTIAHILIVVVVTYLTLVLGELVPKRLGLSKSERIAKIVAAPMNALARIASPIVWLLSKSTSLMVKILGIKSGEEDKVTEEEIKAIVREGVDVGEVQEVEHDIVERVFSLGDRNVSSIMTHRNDLVWLDVNDSAEELRQKVQENLYNVYPVASDKLEDMQGVVYLKDLFGHVGTTGFSLQDLVQPANYLPENQSVYNALEQMKNLRVKHGIITDEFGSVQGIVTLSDILEALIGEVPEADDNQDMVQRTDGSWLVDGQYSFYNFLERFDMEELYADNDYNTLSGLILETLEHIPKEGDKLSWRNFELEIMDMDGARIDKVLVTVKK